MKRRGSTAACCVGPRASTRNSAGTSSRQAALGAADNVWQEPPELVLGTVLERLLAMEDGVRWVRVASHVCSFWRSQALEVVLADTAISKPPLEDFRAIGARRPVPPAKPAAATDTVTTQAAVVMEASASTGMEVMSKQRFDGPAAVVAGTAGPRSGVPGGHRLRMRTAEQAQADARARVTAQRVQRARQQQAAVAAAAAAVAADQPEQPPTAASPVQQQPQAPPAPQGSIQSGMAQGLQAMAVSDSDSGGSTLARVGPSLRGKRRRGARGASAGRGASVEQQQQQQQHPAVGGSGGSGGGRRAALGAAAAVAAAGGHADEAGPSNARTRAVKQPPAAAGATDEARPSKQQRREEQRSTEVDQAGPSRAAQPAGEPAARSGGRQQAAPAAATNHQQQQQQARRGTRQRLRSSSRAASDGAEGPNAPSEQQVQPAAAGRSAGGRRGPRSGGGARGPPSGPALQDSRAKSPAGKRARSGRQQQGAAHSQQLQGEEQQEEQQQVGGEVGKPAGASGPSDAYYEAEGGQEVEQQQQHPGHEMAEELQGGQQQQQAREGSAGLVHAAVGFVQGLISRISRQG